ncbi:phage tail tape measure protein [Streptomyces sp.]|uniref:phage tail tape measure protein n=1 Tax=Streptomyces sp. TaxID=1931 RepID=UPI002F95464E
MPGRTTDLRISIDAETAKAQRSVDALERSFNRLHREMAGELAASAQKAAQAQETLGRSMLGVGVAVVAGLGLATKAAIDWESAWAGVTKTVEGTPEQMAALEKELRGLATTLPATHAEIAGVAEAAGQLGVEREAVSAFTKTMIDLGETTNLTADAAATAIAQLGNVLGLDLKNDVDNFGAALVALGNDGASTEQDILSMAQRISGAGAAIGLSAQEVLGFAAALSNVGIEAEAGGSSISRVMVDIASAVDQGGEKLALFAEVAGVTAEEFAASFEQDPARAIQSFIDGLGRMNDSGQSVFGTLDQLGLSEIRVRDALLRLSASTRGVGTDLDLANAAWEANTALIEEAEKRYETSEAKIQIAKNTLVDLAIDIGGVVLPALTGLVEGAAGLFKWFSDLPDPIKAVATILAGLGGVTALAAGGFLLLAPRIQAASQLLSTIAVTSPGTARGLGLVATAAKGLSAALGFASIAFVVAEALGGIGEAAADAAPSVTEATEALLKLGDGEINAKMQGLFDLLENDGKGSYEGTVELLNSLDSVDKALAGMVASGAPEKAAESLRTFIDQVERQTGIELDPEMFGLYGEALVELDNQQKLTTESMGPLDQGLEALADRFRLTGDDAEAAAQKMLDGWSEGFTDFVDIVAVYDQALADKEQAEHDAAQATADATKDSTDSWEDYAEAVDLTFAEYLAKLEEQVAAQEQWAANMAVLAARGVDDGVLAKLAEMGPAGAALVADAAVATDEELVLFAELFGAAGTSSGAQFATNLAGAGELWAAIAATQGQTTVDELIGKLLAGEITWSEILARYGALLDTEVPPTKGTEVNADVHGATINVNRYGALINALPTKPTTTPQANTVTAEAKIAALIRDRYVNIHYTYRESGGSGGAGPGGGGTGGFGAGMFKVPLNRGSYRVGGGVGSYPGHTGQDLPARSGTPVYASRAGRVSRAATIRGSYGNHIFIEHPGGYQTRYAHLSSRGVSSGQSVGTGQRIGAVGSTGNSTGPHLHFEIRSGGRVIDPRRFVRFARGGVIDGPGGPTDDMVPMWGSNGEYMTKAAAVNHYGVAMFDALNEMRLPKIPHYASGGSVGPTVTAGDLGGRNISITMQIADAAQAAYADQMAHAAVKDINRMDSVGAGVL